MVEPARLGLLLGLGAFLAFALSPALPLLGVPFFLLGFASVALLHAHARRGATHRRVVRLALALAALGFLGLLASNALALSSLDAGDLDLWKATLWPRAAAEVAVAAGFYAAALPLAAARSRHLLGFAFGLGAAVALLAAVASLGPADNLVASGREVADPPGSEAYRAWRDAALGRYFEEIQGATLARPLPFVAFAWAYATILGRLRAAGPREEPAP